MFAVEGAFNRFGEGGGVQVPGQHGGPGNRLKHQPVRAGRCQYGNNQQDMTETLEHA